MNAEQKSAEDLIRDLRERAKELTCLYEVEEILNRSDLSRNEFFKHVIDVVPAGWQYPDICQAKITYLDTTHKTPALKETEWVQTANIMLQDEVVGQVSVYYSEARPPQDEGPFLKEERKLINTIAERLGQHILHQKLKELFEENRRAPRKEAEWWVIIDLLRRTDPRLLLRISRKMTNYLCWSGSKEAEALLEHFSPAYKDRNAELFEDLNRPLKKQALQDFVHITEDIFRIAVDYLGEQETLAFVQKWIREEKSAFLVTILESFSTSHAEITDAVGRYHHLDPEGNELSVSREKGFRVSLVRRLLTDQPQFINVAKQFIRVNDFYDILHRVIFPTNSHGKLGGKSAGLLLACQILKKSAEHKGLFKDIKTPKSWYITSDGILNFMHYNSLEDVVEQKYKEIGQVRQEFPYVVQVFKNSSFPPEIIKGLSLALDDFGETPLIVRSSSLLEDRMGTAFAGKYRSVFIANQGPKRERLLSLMDAVAEVYASTFSPDPIEYRAERGLLDFHEEMGVMIQEVVGQKIGHYFLPAYAGVAFSNNNFRWSPRIKLDDGLVRLVPGLGTRAVDRLSDDYPVLIAPGQPGLRVNATLDEIVRYSPRKVDVINLKTNSFETIELQQVTKTCGHEYPRINQIVSVLADEHLTPPMGANIDFEHDELVVTFEGLLARTPFVKQMRAILATLQAELGIPVDIEFASDGKNLYLLQCRPQSYDAESTPAAIPANIAQDRVLFTANRYISNGTVTAITHIVYVDGENYRKLKTREEMLAVGRLVGRLNQILPKRQFVLMGPGRWGSRGDIKLGVSVTYSDINNTAVLIEIARRQGNYVPDLSFGTHFFQDLAEASIRYLPLYPDDDNVLFNQEFLTKSENILPRLLPEFAHLADTVRLIDVPQASGGLHLQLLMNAELDEAVCLLSEPAEQSEAKGEKSEGPPARPEGEDHWRWRLRMAEAIASQVESERFGVEGFYVFGSTKNATAGPSSDIDLLVHFRGTERQREELLLWLEGWSLCIAEMNYLRTGVESGGLLDIHLVTDEEIRKQSSYAVKIGAVTDAARALSLKA